MLTVPQRFDDGPYLTTVLGLDWIISRVLNTRPIGEFTDYGAVRQQIIKLERQLGITLASASARVEELENIKLSPFSYTDSELSEIAQAFSRVWARPLCDALTRFIPYANFLDHRLYDGTLGLEFQHWYRLYDRKLKERIAGRATSEYGQFLSRLSNRRDDPVGEGTLQAKLSTLEAVKRGNLAFNVVFQRALVDALMEYAKIDQAAVGELEYYWEDEESYPDFGELDEETGEEFGDEWVNAPTALAAEVEVEGGETSSLKARVARRGEEFINAMNRLVDAWPEVLEVNASFALNDGGSRVFWLGTLRKPEGVIDFTQGASNRAKDLLFMAAAMVLYDDVSDPAAKSDFEGFWAQCLEGEGPSVCNRVGRAVARFSNRESSAAGRILKARDEDFDVDVAQEECYWRLRFLWEQLGL
jgi:hypothetical protein